MVKWIEIFNYAVIDHLKIEFTDGLNILTGETGAGKSIIIDAMMSLAGKRLDKTIIRKEEKETIIRALIINNNSQIQIERRITRKNSKNFIDKKSVSLQKLKELIAPHFVIASQHGTKELLNSSQHLFIYDDLADTSKLRKDVKRYFRSLCELRHQISNLEKDLAGGSQMIDVYEHQLNELQDFAPSIEDYETLKKRVKFYDLAKTQRMLLAGLLNRLYEDEGSVLQLLSEANNLFSQSEDENLKRIKDNLVELEGMLDMISDDIHAALQYLDYDEFDYEEAKKKLDRYSELMLKYDVNDISELIDQIDRLSELVERLKGGDKLLLQLKDRYSSIKNEVVKRAQLLRQRRLSQKKRIEQKICKLLSDLNGGFAEFCVEITQREIPEGVDETGAEGIRFLINMNVGESPGPVDYIASGGELSRLYLALSVMGSEKNKTFIFDEVDTGVGGMTAISVGNLLKRLSKSSQVICVTHLPQIAKFADRHIKVEKFTDGSRTYARARVIDSSKEIEQEMKRMTGESMEIQ